ncbi:GntR family transcriptional regulator [Mycobacterium dioxanotrophicus]|uniref:GntR family transcriptional regulator n=1 Tax=Mycobacterium dioxanotrophicus TaxID=482462 RepID=A0A1Y0CCJ3_9MYCO|nr:GntR family transcriptional regulator [Mycobacterium dioxanotrophicus]ART72983.1 GntR family transcriptional regulator [Mycobacterium dioxanotrophicus]
MVTSVQTTLVTDQVYGVIRDAILSGELPVGSRLRVRDMAAMVGTSVMPVREAIRRLEEAGLAERQPHRGAVVKGLTLEELVHVYDVRRLLEVEAARLGAERITAADCDKMQAEYDQMRQAIVEEDVPAYLDRDEALLAILYEASGNPVIVQVIRTLWHQCRSYKLVGAQGTLGSSSDESLWTYQQKLIDAAAANDGPEAAAVNSESLLNATDRIHALLAAQGQSETAAPM